MSGGIKSAFFLFCRGWNHFFRIITCLFLMLPMESILHSTYHLIFEASLKAVRNICTLSDSSVDEKHKIIKKGIELVRSQISLWHLLVQHQSSPWHIHQPSKKEGFFPLYSAKKKRRNKNDHPTVNLLYSSLVNFIMKVSKENMIINKVKVRIEV